MRLISNIAAAAFIASLSACSMVSHDEVARVPSPNGAVDAVVVETNGGATTSFGYQIYVVPHGGSVSGGSQVAYLYGAVRNQDAYGVNLRWPSSSRLAVDYLSAQSVTLKEPTALVARHNVETELVSGVVDPTAPSGGMFYNLQKQKHRHPVAQRAAAQQIAPADRQPATRAVGG